MLATKDGVYKLGCDLDKRVCKLFNYEGKTKQSRVRINEHRSDRKTPGYLNDHFTRGHGKTPASHLTLIGLHITKDKLEGYGLGYHLKKVQCHEGPLLLRPHCGRTSGHTSYSKLSNEIYIHYLSNMELFLAQS